MGSRHILNRLPSALEVKTTALALALICVTTALASSSQEPAKRASSATAQRSQKPAPASRHGAMHGKMASRRDNPHTGKYKTPDIIHDEENSRIGVQTPGGLTWIPTLSQPHAPVGPGGLETPPTPYDAYPRCLTCHWQIENIMANMGNFPIDCVWCHGGDPDARKKDLAHVQPDGTVTYNETIPPLDQDLAYQRFVNPSNLRVVGSTCGVCHYQRTVDIKKSMMATAAGHYSGGLYQNGVVDTKTPIYGTFAVTDTDGTVPTSEGAVASLLDLIAFDPMADPSLAATHFAAVPSQACARCHLWSRGKGYRGAENADGTYRADGCAACHVLYGNDGLTESADLSIPRNEKGHAKHHVITREVPTEQCLHCHHRGARIGLSFTGKAQMPPRLPSGPGVPGTSDEKFNSNFHYTDAETNPMDIHGERGMHCIDCHIASEIMGDGNIWGHMDQATKIECRTCHGLPGQPASLFDSDGGHLPNVRAMPSGDVVLTSKVTHEEHVVPQVMDIVDPMSPNYNAKAAQCMDSNHLKADGGLECYACHSAWVPNCFGCHFERNEQELGLNFVTGQLEVGKIRTNNKIFEALRHFSIGPNSEGRTAPYLVACQPIADVTAPDGSKILDFVMPVTANGLSGLGINPVQPHTVRGKDEVRTCAECHRSPATLGMGSGNYTIARDLIFAAGASGIEQFDRDTDPCQPVPDASFSVAGPVLGVTSFPAVVEGTTDYLYVAQGMGGVSIYDRSPAGASGTPVATIPGIDAIDVSRVARYLFVVENGVGVHIYDNDTPTSATLVATVAIPTAQRAVPWGIHLFVPAGNNGLAIVDVSDHANPNIIRWVAGMNAVDVRLYSHFQKGSDFAVRAYVADPRFGVRIVDLLPNYDSAVLVGGLPLVGATAVDTYTSYVTATLSVPSREHDYLFVGAGAAGLHIFDITDPDAVTTASSLMGLGGSVADLDVVSQLAPPGVDDYAYIANDPLGVQVIDVSDPTSPMLIGTVPGSSGATRLLVETQQMDRYLDEQARQLKENSHPFTGTYSHADIVRILQAVIP